MSERSARKARTQEKTRETLFCAFARFRKRNPQEIRDAWERSTPEIRKRMEKDMRKMLTEAANAPAKPQAPVTARVIQLPERAPLQLFDAFGHVIHEREPHE